MNKSFYILLPALIFAVTSCTDMQTHKTHKKSSYEDLRARLDKMEPERQRKLAQQRELERQQRELENKEKEKAKKRVDVILTKKVVDINDFDFTNYFGGKYSVHKKGEFETQAEYIQRLKALINNDEIYYFEVDAVLSYDADNQYYRISIPKVIDTPFLRIHRDIYEEWDTALARFDFSQRRGQFILVPLKEEAKVSTYAGINSYGAKADVIKIEITEWALAAIFEEFKGMANHGYELSYKEGSYNQDTLVLKVVIEEAKNLGLSKGGVITRVGVKFTYGVGPIALAKDTAGKTPTITEPKETHIETLMLGVDLDSICLIRRSNREVLSCRVHLN